MLSIRDVTRFEVEFEGNNSPFGGHFDAKQRWQTVRHYELFHLHSRYLVQILVHSYFYLVSFLLALIATEPVPEPVTQMALELINNHLISVQQKRYRISANSFLP